MIKKLNDLAKRLSRKVNIMEVCGTHTNSIAKNGLKSLLNENINLISGPGCPVCVSADGDIEAAIDLALKKDNIIFTFADMLRVPGRNGSLQEAKASGADVRVIYSPLDAFLETGKTNKTVILLASGFETTAPLIAVCLKKAKEAGFKNFFVFPVLKLINPAITALLSEENKIDGFLLPGHVSLVIGKKPYSFISKKFNKPGVIGGFEAEEIVAALIEIVKQLLEGKAQIQNAYPAIKEEGNQTALKMIEDVFEPYDAVWRGFGVIPSSGLKIKKEFREFDALIKFNIKPCYGGSLNKACKCAEVLKGKISPVKCPLFGKKCAPGKPLGPCMVSSEGACNALYNYEK
ncbi:(NiFe) hydrogenase maturation protein [Elusimicrobium minutum Pei191]|uniref:(NiFe) hydrogenase maturation protein n=1 Tax=Elusimicrobium minutum (strain Pei191) TaxID=445932 RepID=B2KBC4_ELUMP|nr:hydrogenase formation protein HypD [Elusimicrobium minutum]ACC97946.1 (NiFe) hydrogenase maturation protein [Elusimicrobium minutum Pei191]